MESSARPKKRLVVCCDGTWNRADLAQVTNVEKIARTIQTDSRLSDDVQQLVCYLSGVGTAGYGADRLLGGAFGFGLFDNVRAAYRFLALNYDQGDEIFVFGFSRGAYTARSVVGMIGRVGLLTREALITGHLGEAERRYRRKSPGRRTAHGSSDQRFKAVHSHPDTKVAFLGVFDTVGALGVPGAFRRAHQFHDVRLSRSVLCARQALAIDEHRMKFEPSVWELDPEAGDAAGPPGAADPWVKQVWFEGVHSDVGGGYADTGLSDTALDWMTLQACEQGLRFDERLLSFYRDSMSAAVRHDSLTSMYKVLNAVSTARTRIRRPPAERRHFEGDQRVLGYPPGVGLRIASATATHFLEDREDRLATTSAAGYDPSQRREWYSPANLAAYCEQTHDFEAKEEVEARPAAARATLAPVLSVPEQPAGTRTDARTGG